MKQLKQFPTTDYNKFPQKYYFISVAKNIIKIANLKNTNKIILFTINIIEISLNYFYTH